MRRAEHSNESDWHNSRIIIRAFMSCCSTGHPAESSTKMSFTIIKNLEQLPSYPMLCQLAEQNSVRVTGDERTGSFSGHGMEGDYKFGDDGLHGKFAGHGVTGTFSFEIGKARSEEHTSELQSLR